MIGVKRDRYGKFNIGEHPVGTELYIEDFSERDGSVEVVVKEENGLDLCEGCLFSTNGFDCNVYTVYAKCFEYGRQDKKNIIFARKE